MKAVPVCVLALATMLAGCEMDLKTGDQASQPAKSEASATAAGKAEEGKLSIKAPGFDVALKIPDSIVSQVNVDSDTKILYPGATIGGLHVEAGPKDSADRSAAGVEMRFSSSDAPDKIAAWYRDPARAADFTVSGIRREGNMLVVTGMPKNSIDPFTVRLAPASGGGTDGRLQISDRG